MDPDGIIARAIESVLEQVPGTIDTSVPESTSTKLQPWAETAAPVGRNKRPLEEVVAELQARVSADPDARATLPRTRHPALAFFDRFGRGGGQPDRAGPGEGPRRRRRRRGGGSATPQPAQAAATPANPAGERSQSGRRRRRGRGGSGSGATTPADGGTAAARSGAGAPGGAQPRAPGSRGRRRRGRRGRGERPPAG